MKRQFKIGDIVESFDDYNNDIDHGVVVKIIEGNLYPIRVEFESDNSVCGYTEDGRCDINGDITLRKSDHTWRP